MFTLGLMGYSGPICRTHTPQQNSFMFTLKLILYSGFICRKCTEYADDQDKTAAWECYSPTLIYVFTDANETPVPSSNMIFTSRYKFRFNFVEVSIQKYTVFALRKYFVEMCTRCKLRHSQSVLSRGLWQGCLVHVWKMFVLEIPVEPIMFKQRFMFYSGGICRIHAELTAGGADIQNKTFLRRAYLSAALLK